MTPPPAARRRAAPAVATPPPALLLLLALTGASAAPSPLDAFQPPVAGVYAATSDLRPAAPAAGAADCAQQCLAFGPGCISFNLCAAPGGGLECGIQGWAMTYTRAASPSCAWYRRMLPRDDTPVAQAVAWQLSAPAPRSVALRGGALGAAFDANVAAYLRVRDPADMLHFFAVRAGAPSPPGQCWGWGGWIEGSEAGNFLMGAGSALRWVDDAALTAGVQTVLEGVSAYRDPTTGWLWAFNESDVLNDNLPDYCASWVTRGLLDVAASGVPRDAAALALALARDSVSLFNNHTLLPFFLPANGGPTAQPPFPSGFNNVTDGGYGQPSGHMIYMQHQGMIKHSLMALSGAGTAADVQTAEALYVEDWWLHALIAEDLFHGIYHRQFFAHNYEVTAFEALLDLYVATGNATYLAATMGAWRMLREHWILPGGR